MQWAPWKGKCGEYVYATSLGTQPALKGCEAQLNAPMYCRELWEEGRERDRSLLALSAHSPLTYNKTSYLDRHSF